MINIVLNHELSVSMHLFKNGIKNISAVLIITFNLLCAGSSSNLVAQEAVRKHALVLKPVGRTSEQLSSKNQTSFSTQNMFYFTSLYLQ